LVEEEEDQAENNTDHFSLARIKSALDANPGKKLKDGDKLPQASVCLILKSAPNEKELQVLFIKRRELEGDPWSGHMAFPGGRHTENDEHILYTATREVLEETGIDLRESSILGTLDELVPGNRSIRVTPFVALVSESTEVKMNEQELEDFFWIPISFFQDERNSSTHTIERMGSRFVFQSYLFSGKYVIWGMTLRILQDFLSKIDSHKHRDEMY
jgi:8-oxo-dGTP pyrophosphatase MutT (NUDIX family)